MEKADKTESKAAHHAISTLFPEPIDPTGKPLVVQYEVKLQKGLECGGAYIKLLTESEDGDGLRAGEEYTDKVSYPDLLVMDQLTSRPHSRSCSAPTSAVLPTKSISSSDTETQRLENGRRNTSSNPLTPRSRKRLRCTL